MMIFLNKITAFLIIISFVFSAEAFARRPMSEEGKRGLTIKQHAKRTLLTERKKNSLKARQKVSKRKTLAQMKRVESQKTAARAKVNAKKATIQAKIEAKKTTVKAKIEAKNIAVKAKPALQKNAGATSGKIAIKWQDAPDDLKRDLILCGLKKKDFEKNTRKISQKRLIKVLAALEEAEPQATEALIHHEHLKSIGQDSGASKKVLRMMEILVGSKNNDLTLSKRLRDFLESNTNFQP